MSSSDEYKEIYRRIQRSAGIDGIPRLLALINALELSDYGSDSNCYLILATSRPTLMSGII